jgi:hypothetical protein
MKTKIILVSVLTLLLAMAGQARAKIIAGPITNPANGHDYYLLAPDTWTASEAEAGKMGGTLAIIRNAAEQEWVFAKFGNYDGMSRSLWIGRSRQWPGGPVASVTDEKGSYFNWDTGQPDNAGGVENYVQILNNGRWNDNSDTANPVCGVVEVPGKSNEKALAELEKTLIGTWYENGNGDRPCWLAGTDNTLFAIDNNHNVSRVLSTPEGFVFASDWKQHGEIAADKILWSKGNWWSRKPISYAPKNSLVDTGDLRTIDSQK